MNSILTIGAGATRRVFGGRWLLATLVVAGCGESEGLGLFNTGQAITAAGEFQKALAAGDAATLTQLSQAPFRFQNRTWDTAAEVAANWKKEAVRVKHVVAGFDAYATYSRTDLKEGRWPRNETVDEERRDDRIAKLGLETHGWLVRVSTGVKPGYLLVLNPDGGALKAQAVDW
jgi:hypothetical protein